MAAKKVLTKNQRYELKRKNAGFTKMTKWVATHAIDETEEMIDFINHMYSLPKEQRKKLIPYMMRNAENGQNAGRVPQGQWEKANNE